METEGKYIYCIIRTSTEKDFGPIGIGGRSDEVTTSCYKDIGMVISSHPVTRLAVNRRNTITHAKVLERVMEEFSVLPVRFCTIASDIGEIKNLITARYGEFEGLLKDMDNKVELNIKGLWTNMEGIYEEISEESREIKKLKDEIVKNAVKIGLAERMSVGRMVEDLLKIKKEREADNIISALSKIYVASKHNITMGDEMFMNTAFLIDKEMEKEFDRSMDDLSGRHKERIRFIYAGPFPPYNFANVTIYPEKGRDFCQNVFNR